MNEEEVDREPRGRGVSIDSYSTEHEKYYVAFPGWFEEVSVCSSHRSTPVSNGSEVCR
jgi:hypothetical protein